MANPSSTQADQHPLTTQKKTEKEVKEEKGVGLESLMREGQTQGKQETLVGDRQGWAR